MEIHTSSVNSLPTSSIKTRMQKAENSYLFCYRWFDNSKNSSYRTNSSSYNRL